jgi:hypothetical protein
MSLNAILKYLFYYVTLTWHVLVNLYIDLKKFHVPLDDSGSQFGKLGYRLRIIT